MPKWLDGLTIEIAIFLIVTVVIGLLRVAEHYDRRAVTFTDVWHRRKNDD